MKEDKILNNYNARTLHDDFLNSGGQRIRYNAVEYPVNLLRRIVLFFRWGRWVKVERDFIPVLPGEPGYEDAVYEADIIYDRNEMERLQKLHPGRPHG